MPKLSSIEPFHVFISSDTDEFEKMRAELEDIINSVQLVNSKRVETTGEEREHFFQQIMVAEVVETNRGTTIGGDVKKAIDRSQIYVGIFGEEFSKPTVAEFHYARSQGLLTQIYYFTQPPRLGKAQYDVQKGIRDPVVEFLVNEVKSRDIRIRGNYRKVQLQTPEDLEDEVVTDLGCLMCEMLRESYAVRKVILQTLSV